MSEAARRFARILKTAPTNQINFHLGGLPVTPQGFYDVGCEIEAEHIRLLRSRDLPLTVGAEYRWQENRLVVSYELESVLGTISGRSSIVHEGVHAMIDRNRAVATTILTAEAAAYIAQLIYRLLSGDDLHAWIEANRDDTTRSAGAIYYQALQLIERYRLLTGSATIPWPESQTLRDTISSHPLYRGVRATELHGADGVP
ncbi:MAG: hypothetical protein LLG20_21825 [Acidobacteriales bacterium]|nr:hypothetical protein [Terriglobales bacterium]